MVQNNNNANINNLSSTLDSVAKRLEQFANQLRQTDLRIEATDKIVKEALLLALSSADTNNLVERLVKLASK